MSIMKYYYIKTDCRSNCWDTVEIEDFLRSHMLDARGAGVFARQEPFLNISLMKVKDLNSWSSEDYDVEETNYVSIVTSAESDQNPEIRKLLKKLERFLCFRMCRDNCEREVAI